MYFERMNYIMFSMNYTLNKNIFNYSNVLTWNFMLYWYITFTVVNTYPHIHPY